MIMQCLCRWRLYCVIVDGYIDFIYLIGQEHRCLCQVNQRPPIQAARTRIAHAYWGYDTSFRLGQVIRRRESSDVGGKLSQIVSQIEKTPKESARIRNLKYVTSEKA